MWPGDHRTGLRCWRVWPIVAPPALPPAPQKDSCVPHCPRSTTHAPAKRDLFWFDFIFVFGRKGALVKQDSNKKSETTFFLVLTSKATGWGLKGADPNRSWLEVFSPWAGALLRGAAVFGGGATAINKPLRKKTSSISSANYHSPLGYCPPLSHPINWNYSDLRDLISIFLRRRTKNAIWWKILLLSVDSCSRQWWPISLANYSRNDFIWEFHLESFLLKSFDLQA